MKLEIIGNERSGRKILMDGNDITAQCESVEISVNPLEPTLAKVTYIGADVAITNDLK